MDFAEASLLYDFICLERRSDTVRIHPLDGGEYVVILQHECYWLWSAADWTVFRERRETDFATSHRRD
jgi:hypothetical protein